MRFAASALIAIRRSGSRPVVNGENRWRRGRFGVLTQQSTCGGVPTRTIYRLGWRWGKEEDEEEEKSDFSSY